MRLQALVRMRRERKRYLLELEEIKRIAAEEKMAAEKAEQFNVGLLEVPSELAFTLHCIKGRHIYLVSNT